MFCAQKVQIRAREKMKVGDLVMLSSYGRKVKRTGWVASGDKGLVKSERNNGGWVSYRVHWMKSHHRQGDVRRQYQTRGSSWDWEPWFDRRDLRFLKKIK